MWPLPCSSGTTQQRSQRMTRRRPLLAAVAAAAATLAIAGINRRNEAIAETERWARVHCHRIQFSYTLPTLPTGLTPDGVAVLENAIADHARITTVNLLTF